MARRSLRATAFRIRHRCLCQPSLRSAFASFFVFQNLRNFALLLFTSITRYARPVTPWTAFENVIFPEVAGTP